MSESWTDNPEVTHVLQAAAQNLLLSPVFQDGDIMLDDESFRVHAYQHELGIVITSPDSVKRRFYPHIFIYFADCPEE